MSRIFPEISINKSEATENKRKSSPPDPLSATIQRPSGGGLEVPSPFKLKPQSSQLSVPSAENNSDNLIKFSQEHHKRRSFMKESSSAVLPDLSVEDGKIPTLLNGNREVSPSVAKNIRLSYNQDLFSPVHMKDLSKVQDQGGTSLTFSQIAELQKPEEDK